MFTFFRGGSSLLVFIRSLGWALEQCTSEDKQCSNGLGSTSLRIKRIDRRSKLDLHDFIEQYEAKFVPVVITDYAKRIIEEHGLSLENIERLCGDKHVKPYMYNASSTEWARMEKTGAITVHDFLTYFQQESASPSSSEPLYMFDWVLLNNCRELGQTITIPKYVARDAQKLILSKDVVHPDLSDSPWPSLFMSPSTLHGSGLHIDGGYSSFWMYLGHGRKRWRITNSKYVKHLGPRRFPERVTPHLEADLFKPDFKRFPGLADVGIWEADIGPGDLIIVPSGSAHQVLNLSPSVAIAGNFISPHGMKYHQKFLTHLFKAKLGDESMWPNAARKGVRKYGDKQFFRDVSAVLPETDVSFEEYHAGIPLPGW